VQKERERLEEVNDALSQENAELRQQLASAVAQVLASSSAHSSPSSAQRDAMVLFDAASMTDDVLALPLALQAAVADVDVVSEAGSSPSTSTSTSTTDPFCLTTPQQSSRRLHTLRSSPELGGAVMSEIQSLRDALKAERTVRRLLPPRAVVCGLPRHCELCVLQLWKDVLDVTMQDTRRIVDLLRVKGVAPLTSNTTALAASPTHPDNGRGSIVQVDAANARVSVAHREKLAVFVQNARRRTEKRMEVVLRKVHTEVRVAFLCCAGSIRALRPALARFHRLFVGGFVCVTTPSPGPLWSAGEWSGPQGGRRPEGAGANSRGAGSSAGGHGHGPARPPRRVRCC
jgi:hypothetical protein